MSARTLIHRSVALTIVCALLIGSIAPAVHSQGADAPIYMPMIGGEGESAPRPDDPPTPRPADPVLQATGDPNLPPTNQYGPKREVPGEGPQRTRAYEPFGLDKRQDPTCPPHGCDAIAGEVAVKFSSTYLAAQGEMGVASVNATFAGLGITGLEPLFPEAPVVLAGELIETPDGDPMPKPDLRAWYRAGLVDTEMSVVETAAALRELPEVVWAEPVYVRRPTGMPASGLAAEGVAAPAAQITFDDPLYAQQWHLAAANVPAAWDYLANEGLPPGGNRDIVVAVIDTGIDLTHPDLVANLWVDPQQPTIHGRNFTDPAKVNDPSDDHGHGTHVAGIIAAQAGNDIGGVGVAYNVQVMALKAAQYSGVLASTHIAQAIYYAVENGADVINMSFGGYARSQVEEDALAVAFGTAVLVAAAGNDGLPNEEPCPRARPMYPAAYNWVLGVMAALPGGGQTRFSNWNCVLRTSLEYEVSAPGVDIWSTLPLEQYSAWSGTSMAAPFVAGMAALARTQWSDKEVYSSRFIMGQIAANAEPNANALAMLENAPQPHLQYLQHWLFDTPAINSINDDDGIVDAGETVELAVVIRNHWGKADTLTVKLEAWAENALQPDPYVTWDVDTVHYGAVGSFNQDDNGLLYDNDLVVGVQNPFRFTVNPGTPNDHVIPMRVTMTAVNGYDPDDPGAPYTFTSRFNLMVQRGRVLPTIISEDMVLSKEHLWLVPAPTLIHAGVTVTATKGAQISFVHGAVLQVEGQLLTTGTDAEPVEVFPTQSATGVQVKIMEVHNGQIQGQVRLAYTRIRNFFHDYIQSVDHGYFDADMFSFVLSNNVPVIRQLSNSIFVELGYAGYQSRSLRVSSDYLENNLFDSTLSYVSSKVGSGNVFLKNYRISPEGVYHAPNGTSEPGYDFQLASLLRVAFPETYEDRTYFLAASRTGPAPRLHTMQVLANQIGGNIVSISSAQENQFLHSYLQQSVSESSFRALYPTMNCSTPSTSIDCWTLFSSNPQIGLTRIDDSPGFKWINGEPFSYTNWGSGYPDSSSTYTYIARNDGRWRTFNPGGQSASLALAVLEVAGVWDQEALDVAREATMSSGLLNDFRGNAFLNVYHADPSLWLRFRSSNDRGIDRFLGLNYWGTTSTDAIDQVVIDQHDNFNMGILHYLPILTEAPETAYPFVVNVDVGTAAGPGQSEVGAEPVTFTVTFNRDMDMAVQPQVSFGPAVPFTDYTIRGIDGGWQDPRTWVGTYTITPVTGDGYQLIRVAGAVAADDPWLVTGDDSERFRFEVITSGTESMNLQASGGEGYVDLMWTQTDFDLLAGFNVYRSATSNGTYTRINDGLIPSHIREYRDTTVTPGQPYFYKFTVVQTSMAESDFSNTATATPVDTIPPVISHSPVPSAPPGLNLALHADVTDNVAVQAVTLYYRAVGGSTYSSLPMVKTTGDRYNATIPGSALVSPGIQYYIAASDGVSTVTHGRPEYPHTVAVSDRPVVTTVSPLKGPSAGGTALTVSGSNFKVGATVTLGGAACGDVTVVGSSQITCVTPPRFPGTVDVVVTNPDSQSGTKLNAFTFESDSASLSLPDLTAGRQTVARVPVNVANLQGLVAGDLAVTFDPTVLTFLGASTGTLTPGWTILANVAPAGRVNVALISPGGGVSGDGVLLYLDFDVVGDPTDVSALTPVNVLLNDGSIPVETAAGSVTVEQVYQIGGTIQYWNGGIVPATTLQASGDRAYSAESDETGVYALAEMARGNYTVTPVKSNQVDAISAYDASLVLQHAIQALTLSGHAATAADVNKSGAINSMDAYYILQAAVGLMTPPFPGAGKVWEFAPASRSYTNLSADQHNHHYTAILLGEVSGNWDGAVAIATADSPVAGLRRDAFSIQRTDDGFVTLPITVDPQGNRLFSLEFTLVYTGAIEALAPLTAVNTAEWMVVDNRSTSGRLRVAMAGTAPITTTGPALQLTFRVDPQATLTVHLQHAVADEQGMHIDPPVIEIPPIPKEPGEPERTLYLPSTAR